MRKMQARCVTVVMRCVVVTVVMREVARLVFLRARYVILTMRDADGSDERGRAMVDCSRAIDEGSDVRGRAMCIRGPHTFPHIRYN